MGGVGGVPVGGDGWGAGVLRLSGVVKGLRVGLPFGVGWGGRVEGVKRGASRGRFCWVNSGGPSRRGSMFVGRGAGDGFGVADGWWRGCGAAVFGACEGWGYPAPG
ncbi:hypothetical protein Ahu01nite_055140 [Winogradskya humida]|uniref:Uncharacterized protein n=1 Tax=Winogradskya humida TaxID=113566 RepID=A0ABQ3ZUY0_9ACTN|nr:hypothetical protein Ahu01nite_055140 [Actinoplanes humidus]